jgi:hypothetical protein
MFAALGRRLSFIFGAAMLAGLGRNRFYQYMQGTGIFVRFARDFAEYKDARWVTSQWANATASAEDPGPTKLSIAEYGEGRPPVPDDLDATIRRQKDELYFPLIDELTQSFDIRSIVEVGSGAGDDLIRLANTYRHARITGVDFARPVREYPTNAVFKEGYARDLIESGLLNGDMLVAWGTFCWCTPYELSLYAKAIKERSFRVLLIVEPIRGAFEPLRYNHSMHVKDQQWGHNYKAAFPEFEVYRFQKSNFSGNRHWMIALTKR